MQKKEIKKVLGVFQVNSGEILISDPCYSLGTWCTQRIKVPLIGVWLAIVIIGTEDRIRVLEVECINPCDVAGTEISSVGRFLGEVGVDSGQLGIYDIKHFKDDDLISKLFDTGKACRILDLSSDSDLPGDKWYWFQCVRTLVEKASIIPYGVVSSSGYGDGNYPIEVWEDKLGRVIKINVKFF